MATRISASRSATPTGAESAAPAAATRKATPRTRQSDGVRAEALVARWLEQRGYAIVAKNLRVGRLELDLVVRRGAVVAVVEVRTRGTTAWTTGFGSIDGKKRLHVRRAGERLWQRRYRHDPSVERLRFDVASVRLDRSPPTVEYVIAAF